MCVRVCVCYERHEQYELTVGRLLKCSMDSLKFVCLWRDEMIDSGIAVKLHGIQLEGCKFDGRGLTENQRDSASFTEIPPCKVSWQPKVSTIPGYNTGV